MRFELKMKMKSSNNEIAHCCENDKERWTEK